MQDCKEFKCFTIYITVVFLGAGPKCTAQDSEQMQCEQSLVGNLGYKKSKQNSAALKNIGKNEKN